LMTELAGWIEAKKLKQAEAAEILGEPPRRLPGGGHVNEYVPVCNISSHS
jgi:hypothetical protein